MRLADDHTAGALRKLHAGLLALLDGEVSVSDQATARVAGLLALCESALQHLKGDGHDPLEGSSLRLDATRLRVTANGRDMALTKTEFALLSILLREAGRVVTYREICEETWHFTQNDSGLIKQHIKRLKAKLLDGLGYPWPVTNVRGIGYAWERPAQGAKAAANHEPESPAGVMGA